MDGSASIAGISHMKGHDRCSTVTAQARCAVDKTL